MSILVVVTCCSIQPEDKSQPRIRDTYKLGMLDGSRLFPKFPNDSSYEDFDNFDGHTLRT